MGDDDVRPKPPLAQSLASAEDRLAAPDMAFVVSQIGVGGRVAPLGRRVADPLDGRVGRRIGLEPSLFAERCHGVATGRQCPGQVTELAREILVDEEVTGHDGRGSSGWATPHGEATHDHADITAVLPTAVLRLAMEL